MPNMKKIIVSITVLMLAAIIVAGQARPKADRDAYLKDAKKYSSDITRHPDDPDAYILRARAYRSLGRQEDAIADLTKAIGLSKHPYYVAQATTNRGEIYLELGEYSTAEADFSAVIELEGALPYKPRAYLGRARSLRSADRRADAQKDADEAIRLYSAMKGPSAKKRLGVAYALRASIRCADGNSKLASDDAAKAATLGSPVQNCEK
jgi:tetratricopeptide (TPR) repeat protein